MIDNYIFKDRYNFDDLVEIMAILRSKDGCPWDIEQDHNTIRNSLIEETYEAVEAIDNKDKEALKEELGDVLLQVVFHAQIAKEAAEFDMDEVCDGICKKLIHRHPHVFGSVVVSNSDEVLTNWAEIKKEEKHQTSVTDELNGVARSLPSLMRAQKILKRAKKAGVLEDDSESDIDNMIRVSKQLKSADEKEKGTLIGKLLMYTSSLSQSLKIDEEELLYRACDDFINKKKI